MQSIFFSKILFSFCISRYRGINCFDLAFVPPDKCVNYFGAFVSSIDFIFLKRDKWSSWSYIIFYKFILNTLSFSFSKRMRLQTTYLDYCIFLFIFFYLIIILNYIIIIELKVFVSLVFDPHLMSLGTKHRKLLLNLLFTDLIHLLFY